MRSGGAASSRGRACRWCFYLPLLALCALAIFLTPRDARAQCPNCLCEIAEQAATQGIIAAETTATQADIVTEFQLHEELFMIEYFFEQHILGAMQDMTEQLTTVAMQQMNAIGAFLDAKQELETQRLFQQKMAQAHKDYQPSTEMCSLGTVAQGLASSYRNGEATAAIMQKRGQDRQVGARDINGAGDPGNDISDRIRLFKQRYCDVNDNNGGLTTMCGTSAPVATIDKDVDFTRTVYHPLTLNVDYTDAVMTDDEQDVMSLGANLYASQIFPKLSDVLVSNPGNANIIVELRGVMAARSVAENSYDAIVGMKAADTTKATQNAQYLDAVLMQMGATQVEAKALIGDKPSYYARMELLTKKIYQDPSFYTGLYDTPANLARKGAALRAISLMQHMDMFKSGLRNEAMLAELVELDINKAQEDVQDQVNRMKATGAKH